MRVKAWWALFVTMATLRSLSHEVAEWSWLNHQNAIRGIGRIV